MLILLVLIVLTSCSSTKITTEKVEKTYADIVEVEDKEMSKGTQKVEEAIPEIKEIKKEVITDFFGKKTEKIIDEVIIQEFVPKKIIIGIKDVRLRTEVIKDQEIVVETKEDNSLEKGVEKVIQEGQLGEIEITYEDIYYKDVLDSSKEISRKVIVEKAPKIIHIGIREVRTRTVVVSDKELVVVKRYDATLEKGIEKVVQQGTLGKVEITYEDIYLNDVLDSSKEISRKVLVQAVDRIISVGTKESTTTNYLNYSNKDLSWWYRPGTPKATIDSGVAAMIAKYNVYWQLPTTQKVVYLTFDEGYEYKQNTLSILNTLKTKGVKATFFITGGYYNSHPELVKKMMAEGHQVANHTINHYRASTALNDSTQKYIDDVVNLDKLVPGMVKLHRPPEGGYSERSLKILKDLGYKTVFWSFAYRDWETANQPDPVAAKQKILDNIHPGSILLLHAVSDTNVSILGDVIDGIRAKGYVIQQLPR